MGWFRIRDAHSDGPMVRAGPAGLTQEPWYATTVRSLKRGEGDARHRWRDSPDHFISVSCMRREQPCKTRTVAKGLVRSSPSEGRWSSLGRGPRQLELVRPAELPISQDPEVSLKSSISMIDRSSDADCVVHRQDNTRCSLTLTLKGDSSAVYCSKGHPRF